MSTKPSSDVPLDLTALSDGQLRRIAKKLGLSSNQTREFTVVVRHIVQDVRELNDIRVEVGAREDLVKKLQQIEKELGRLRRTLNTGPDEVTALMPRGTGDFLALAFDAKALGKLLQKDLAQASRAQREAVALKNSGPLLASLIASLHRPFQQWVTLDSQNKGGRPADWVRRLIVAELAQAAAAVLGRPAAVSSDGPFARLCDEVVAALGLETKGLDKLVPKVVKSLRS